MTKGRCPKCGNKDVRSGSSKAARAAIQVTAFRGAYVKHYVCVSCGFVEMYVTDPKYLQLIAEKWKE